MYSLCSAIRRGFLPAMLLFLLSAAALIAGAPGKPVEFKAQVDGNPPFVKLSWQANRDGSEATGYRIYAASGETEDMSKFDMILDTTSTSAIITGRSGVWTFFVRAYNADGTSDRSIIKVVNIKAEEVKMKFLTTPKNSVGSNQKYVYEAKAWYMNNDDVIKYYIITGPQGMTINENTGRVEWTSGAPGKYSVVIRAYLSADSSIFVNQEWKIEVTGGGSNDNFRFTTSPSLRGSYGKQWVYEAQAMYWPDSNAQIIYSIVDGPDGMEINPKTGRITWTPHRTGEFVVIIRARVDGHPDLIVDQRFVIVVDENGANNDFRFITTPSAKGSAGKQWVYEARAEYMPDSNAEIIYSIVDGPDGMEINPKTGRIVWTPQRNGEFVVIIRARVDGHPDLIVDQKFVIVVGNGEHHEILFKSQPKSVACINKEYVYEPVAIIAANIQGTIQYSLTKSPDGMKINPQTGRVSWTPKNEGEYLVEITATIANAGATFSAKQSWTIKARSVGCGEKPSLCAKIYGSVTDQNGNIVEHGLVAAVRTDNGDGRFVGEINRDGSYVIPVPEGTFAVYIFGDDIIPEWYKDAQNIKDAVKIALKCGEKETANITVQRREPPQLFTVSGKVSDAAGAGVMSLISFIVKENNGVDNKEKSSQFIARTNADGSYSIMLPNNYTYTAQAAPLTDKYLPIYFDNTPNAREAALIKLDANREINFTLPERPTYQNGFSGQLINQDGGIVVGKAIAIRISEANTPINSAFMSATVETNANGEFAFANLNPGKYILLGSPATRDWAPGFYRQDALAVVNWKEATIIEVGNDVLAQTFVVKLRRVEGRIGGGHIHGFAHSGKKGVIKGDNTEGVDPLAGVLVVAYDNNNLIADYSFTAADGSYNLTELGAGVFTISLVKPNYDAATFSVAIDYNSSSNIDANDATLSPTSAAGVYEDASAYNAGVYPNPANGAAILRFNGAEGVSYISVVNAIGATMQSFAAPSVAGENNVSLDLGSLQSGLYFVRVTNKTAVFSIPVTIAR